MPLSDDAFHIYTNHVRCMKTLGDAPWHWPMSHVQCILETTNVTLSLPTCHALYVKDMDDVAC